jgi:hypothetical protein
VNAKPLLKEPGDARLFYLPALIKLRLYRALR